MAAKHIMQAEKVRIHHPKFLAERIKLSLLGKNYTNQEFREYLQDTYPFLQKDEVQAIHTLSPAQQKYYEKIVALFIQCLKEKEEIKQ